MRRIAAGFKTPCLLIFLLTITSVNAKASDTVENLHDKNAPRIVTLSPALTEIAYALSLDKNIVGVSALSNYPPEASSKPSVGPYTKPLFEKIIALKPTLVLVNPEGPAEVLKRLSELKISYLVVPMQKLADIPTAMATIGAKTGKASEGASQALKWREKMSEIRRRFKRAAKSPLVIIEVQQEPLIVAGKNTFLSEIVELCGAKNIFDEFEGYPHISTETLLKQKTALAIVVVDHFEQSSQRDEVINYWKSWPSFEKTKLYFFEPDLTSRPGPRLILGIEMICKKISSL